MSISEKFCLKWNDFQENIISAFKYLREDSDLTDVTLACEGNQQIQAHKVILSASSPVFKTLLSTYKNQTPLIYMKGVTANHLTSIVDFIYYGEANVSQEDLNNFLALAEEFQLKGLTGNSPLEGTGNTNSLEKSKSEKGEKKDRNTKQDTSNDASNQNQTLETNEKDEKTFYGNELIPFNLSETFVLPSHEELDQTIENMMEKNSEGWVCKRCGKLSKFKGDIKNHIEGKHIEGMEHPCNTCGKVYRSRNSLRNHKSVSHKE